MDRLTSDGLTDWRNSKISARFPVNSSYSEVLADTVCRLVLELARQGYAP
jgi:hypothetical protein